MSTTLFRQEAIDHQRFRIWGEVAIALPNSYTFVTGFIALSVLATVLFIASHQYARKEHAPGFLVPTEGIARITLPRTGTITIGSDTFTVNQDATCSVAVSPASQSIGISGGTGSVTVTAGAGCGWSVVSNAVWLTVTSPVVGSGNGTIAFSASANNGTASRSGTISVGGQTATVTQAACSFSVSPASVSVGLQATSGTLSVSTTSGCSWTATTGALWVTLGAGGTGSGTLTYSLTANSSSTPRIATILVAGQQISVTQGSTASPATPTGLIIKR